MTRSCLITWHSLANARKASSFLDKAEHKRRLRSVPNGAVFIVDGTKALDADAHIDDTRQEFETAAGFRSISVDDHQVFGKPLTST